MSAKVNYGRVYNHATTTPGASHNLAAGYFRGDIWIVDTDLRAWLLVDQDNGTWVQCGIMFGANAGTLDTDGEIAIDTSITDWSHGLIRYYAGEECVVIAVPVAQAAGMSDGDVLVYKAASDEFQLEQPAASGDTIPPGTSAWFGSSTPPTGWLEEDGSAISRTTYADLFAEIGTTWGVGDGATTFNLPDSRGEFKRGWDNAKGTDSGRTFASSQADAFEDHRHYMQTDVSRQSGGAARVTNGTGANWQTGNAATGTSATETRPLNYSWLPIIKY